MYVKCEHSQNYFKKTECKVPSKTKSCQNTDKKSVSSTSNQRSRPFTAVNKQNSSQQLNRFAPLYSQTQTLTLYHQQTRSVL